MVGNLAAHLHPSAAAEPQAAPLVATGPETAVTLTLELTRGQLEALVDQWEAARRNTPADLVVTMGGRPVGVFRVVASLLGPAPPEQEESAP